MQQAQDLAGIKCAKNDNHGKYIALLRKVTEGDGQKMFILRKVTEGDGQ